MGFAKEIEDFVSGYSTISKLGIEQGDAAMRKEEWKLKKEALEQQAMEALATDPTAIPGVARTKKIKVKKVTADPADETVEMAADDAAVEEEKRFPGYQFGGVVEEAVPSFAEGGAVTATRTRVYKRPRRPVIGDWFNQREEPEAEAGAVPEEAPRQTSSNDPSRQAMIDQGHQPSIGPGPMTGKAVKAAVDSFNTDAQSRQAVGGREPDVDLITGKGAASPAEIRAMDQVIDPTGQLDAIQKGKARLQEAYNYWMSRGFPEKAANVAKRILLFDKNQSMVKGVMASHMIQDGNLSQAAKLLQDTYNQHYHDGKQMQTQDSGNGNISYQFIDEETGEVVEEGVADANQLATMATVTANGSQYVRSTVGAADDETKKEEGVDPNAAAAAEPVAAPAVPTEAAPPPVAPAAAATPEPAAAAPAAAEPAAVAEPAPAEALPTVDQAGNPIPPGLVTRTAADALGDLTTGDLQPGTSPEEAAAAEAVAQPAPAAAAETAIPETATTPEPAAAEPAAPAAERKPTTKSVNFDQAIEGFEYWSSVVKTYDARTDPETGKLSPEDRKKRAAAKRRQREYAEVATTLRTKTATKKADRNDIKVDFKKDLREIAEGAEEFDQDEFTAWETSQAAGSEIKKLVAGKQLAQPPEQTLTDAQEAIDQGASLLDIAKRMVENGQDPSGLTE